MDDSQARKFQKDLNAGLVALVLLAVLDRSPEEIPASLSRCSKLS